MSFMSTESYDQTMLYEILNCPLFQRCSELGMLIDRSSVKELQDFFVPIVNSIFGVPGGIGWGFRTITRQAAQPEFDLLCNFFTPLGPMFRLCYRLLNESNSIKFDIPIELLPKKTTQMLHSRHFSQFYADKINIEPCRREIISLSLNAFDYYMLHFVLHGMQPLHKSYPGALAVHNENWKTIYFYLTADYLCSFLPGNPDTVVLPSNICNSMKVTSTMPIQPIQPTRSPKYLSLSALSSHNFSSVDTTSIRTDEAALRAHSWRTESVLLLFIDTWLRYSVEDNRDLPSSEFIRVVRILVKQLHSFGNVADLDNTSMSSLRKLAQPMMNAQLYTFLRGIIARWPLDSSFSVVLELWLSYIQPWRYIYNRMLPNTPQQNMEIHKRYESFITENMISYTQIFVQLLPRFERLDFSSIKNVHMMYRLTKVFGQSNLSEILRNIEQVATISKASPTTTNPSPSYQQHRHNRTFSPDRSYHSDNSYNSTTHNRSIGHHNLSTDNITPTQSNQINEWSYFRPDNVQDTYVCMFGPKIQSELQFLVRKLLITKEMELERAANMEFELKQSRAGFVKYCRWLFAGDDNFVIEQALQDCRKIPEILDHILYTISNMFEIELADAAGSVEMYGSRVSWNNTDVTDAKSENEADSLFLCPSPIVMRKRSRLIKYTGDPALIPVRSNEFTILVRIFYQISARLNLMFSNEMAELWQRQDFIGRITRQILSPPMIAQSFVKSQGISELNEETLGPRLNLRFFGTYQAIGTISLSFLFGQLFFGIPSVGFLFLIICTIGYICLMSFISNNNY